MLILQADYLGELIKQGPLFGALGIAIYYFYNKTNKLEEEIKNNGKKMEEYHKEDRIKMYSVISDNIKTTEENTAYREKKTKEIMSRLDDLLDINNELIKSFKYDREIKIKLLNDINDKAIFLGTKLENSEIKKK